MYMSIHTFSAGILPWWASSNEERCLCEGDIFSKAAVMSILWYRGICWPCLGHWGGVGGPSTFLYLVFLTHISLDTHVCVWGLLTNILTTTPSGDELILFDQRIKMCCRNGLNVVQISASPEVVAVK